MMTNTKKAMTYVLTGSLSCFLWELSGTCPLLRTFFWKRALLMSAILLEVVWTASSQGKREAKDEASESATHFFSLTQLPAATS